MDFDGDNSLWQFLEDLTGGMIRCGMRVASPVTAASTDSPPVEFGGMPGGGGRGGGRGIEATMRAAADAAAARYKKPAQLVLVVLPEKVRRGLITGLCCPASNLSSLPRFPPFSPPAPTHPAFSKHALQFLNNNACNPPPPRAQTADEYREVKRVSDIELGIPSQVVVASKVREGVKAGEGRRVPPGGGTAQPAATRGMCPCIAAAPPVDGPLHPHPPI